MITPTDIFGAALAQTGLLHQQILKRFRDRSVYKPIHSESEITAEEVVGQAEKILASKLFSRSKRLRSLLRFVVCQTLQGNENILKEYTIGTEVLEKSQYYDTRSDSLARVLASRLRSRLKQYYDSMGEEDPVVIELPKGKYVPKFCRPDDTMRPEPAQPEKLDSQQELVVGFGLVDVVSSDSERETLLQSIRIYINRQPSPRMLEFAREALVALEDAQVLQSQSIAELPENLVAPATTEGVVV